MSDINGIRHNRYKKEMRSSTDTPRTSEPIGSSRHSSHTRRLRASAFSASVITNNDNEEVSKISPDTCLIKFKFRSEELHPNLRGKIIGETNAMALDTIKETLKEKGVKNLIIDLDGIGFESETFFSDILNLDVPEIANPQNIICVGINDNAQAVLRLIGVFSKLKHASSVEQAIEKISQNQPQR